MKNVFFKAFAFILSVILLVFLVTGYVIDYDRFLYILSQDISSGEVDGVFNSSVSLADYISQVRSMGRIIPAFTNDWIIASFGIGDARIVLTLNFLRDFLNSVTAGISRVIQVLYICYLSIAYVFVFVFNLLRLLLFI